MSLYRNIVDVINLCYSKAIICAGNILYRNETKKLLKLHPNYRNKVENEKLWLKKWGKLRVRPDISAYRLFSRYIGNDLNIVPENISSGIIQPLLNPGEYRPYYEDKNMFDKILPLAYMPRTLLRGINGVYYDVAYQTVSLSVDLLETLCQNIDRIFVKPAVDTSSGQGVVAFNRNDKGMLVSVEGEVFDERFLKEYATVHPNFIVQKGLSQSRYISQFNPTSINTLRISTYRSVVDNKTHVCAAIMRIGKAGSTVDNAHAGGLFVGVGLDGVVGKYACDQYGNRYDVFNGINFKEQNFCIPDFDKILRFAEDVSSYIVHHRLVALDICIEADGTPRLVEFNIRAYSVWLFQFTSGTALGTYADEIIDYCSRKAQGVRKVFVEPF